MDNLLDFKQLSNLDIEQVNKILDTLTPKEKELALSVLQEYMDTGQSKIMNTLVLDDYAEVPVDIITFVDDYHYLGNAWHNAQGKSTLYPYWREKLQEIFPNNLDTDFNNAIFTGSRGRGKSEIACLIAAYLLYRILCLKDPIEHFHLKSTEKIVFAFMNIKKDLAEEIANTKFQNSLKSSPWFMAHGTLEGRSNKLWMPPKYDGQEIIDIKIGSGPSDVIGLPIYFAFFDEISFIKNKSIEEQRKKAQDMIDTAIGGMKTRFLHKGKNPTLLILASSKRSDKSFLEDHMQKKLKNSEEGGDESTKVFISDGPVWEVKPKETYCGKTFRVAIGNKLLESVIMPEDADEADYIKRGYTRFLPVPTEFKGDFLDDIDRALCDFGGISSSGSNKYIQGKVVADIINPQRQNAFRQEILTIGTGPEDKEVQYYDYFEIDRIPYELRSKPLFIHLDMSKTGDKTGIAGIFIKGKKYSNDEKEQSNDLYYSLAFATSIKAPKGREISFAKNRQFIRWLRRQGFNIKGISCDTYQSADLQQILEAEGYPIETISVDRVDPKEHVCLPYHYFKNTILEHRLELFEQKLLFQEITELERDLGTGKVDHPAEGSKDAADAVCGAIYNASQHAEEFAHDYGEQLQDILEYNNDTHTLDAHELSLNLENELKRMGGIFKSMQSRQQTTEDLNKPSSKMFDEIVVL